MQVRSRPAFTLVESVVVLGVMGVLITSFTLIPRSEKQTWSKFEREFNEAYMIARQRQVGRNEEFYIDETIPPSGGLKRLGARAKRRRSAGGSP